MKVLQLKGSIMGNDAYSSTVADAYVKSLGNIELEVIDLNESQFSKEMLTSKTRPNYFDDSKKWIDKLKEVDLLVISTSMTNFGYTAVVKNFVDKICLAGESFKYKYNGKGESEGLIKTDVQIITSQGAPKGWYTFGDHTIQLEGTFKFLGMNVLEPIIIAGTKTKELKDKTPQEWAEELIK